MMTAIADAISIVPGLAQTRICCYLSLSKFLVFSFVVNHSKPSTLSMEEGEIADYLLPQSRSGHRYGVGEIYDPAYEWPGESSSQTLDVAPSETSPEKSSALSSKKRKSKTPSLRLVVLRTSILPAKHKLAIVDGYSELQLGRDVPSAMDMPKLRLKEMEISKLHATVYWDAQRREWSIVDMGSKHGTFLKTGTPDPQSFDDAGSRLSPPRVASVPRRLRHLDHLTLGSTTFVVHIHDRQVPCGTCSPLGDDEIPLFHSHKSLQAVAMKRSRDAAGLDTPSYTPKLERDPKRALSMLKHNLLSQRQEHHASRSQSPSDTSPQYVDRSARRRAFHPSTHVDSPGVPSPSVLSCTSLASSSISEDVPVPQLSPEPVSQPPTPLPSSNIGHQLLMKQGWTPGTALGTMTTDPDEGRVGLVEPLQINPTTHRAGLGNKDTRTGSAQLPPCTSWKEKGLYQRWSSFGPDPTSSER
ncbi:hypothetical protein AX17_007331 [Amanita inopinata Kibby_2008]|nr:hypothetical protein AX17_007331 [Amanita inopinata Kibby_2008]